MTDTVPLAADGFAALQAGAQRAEDRYHAGDPGGALDGYARLLGDRIAGLEAAGRPLAAAELWLVERLADLAVETGRADEADLLLDAMAGLAGGAGNRYTADYATLKRVQLALSAERPRKADQLFRSLPGAVGELYARTDFTPEALARWETRCHWPDTTPEDRAILFARLHHALGGLLAATGRYAEARGALLRGLAHAGAGAPVLAGRMRGPLLAALAGADLESGRLEEAGEWLERIAAAPAEGGPGQAARVLELRGKLALLRGDYGAALAAFRQAVRTLEERAGADAALRARLNLAHVLILLNQTHAATALIEGAAGGDGATADRARAMLLLASARRASLAEGVSIAPSVTEMWGEEPGEAPSSPALDAAELPDLPQAGSFLAFFEDRALELHWYLARRDLDGAREALEHMRAVFGGTDSRLIRARLRVLDGLAAYYGGDPAGAAATLDAALPELRAIGVLPEVFQAQRLQGWCWTRLGAPPARRQALQESSRELLEGIAASLDGSERGFYLLNKWTAEEEQLAGAVQALAPLQRRAAGASRPLRPLLRLQLARRVRPLVEQVDRYRALLAARRANGDGQEPGGTRAPARPLWSRWAGHPRDGATLTFLVLPDRTVVFVARRWRLEMAVSPLTRVELRERVREWHECVSGEERPDPARLRRIAEALAEKLQLPGILDSLPPSVRSLTIVPDDVLHGFPFAALVHGGRYLVERWGVHVAFDSAARGAPRREGPVRAALLAGVGEGAGRFADLAFVAREMDRVEGCLRGQGMETRRLDDGREGLRRAILDGLPAADLFHVACHSVFKPDAPDGSGLVVRPAERIEDEELVSLRDLSRLDLGRVRHVTLSSCWAADSFVLPGRWVISLPETLCRAGAGSVLGSLWEVDDEVAVAFTGAFYEALPHHPRDQALRRVQQLCLAGALPGCADVDTADPFFWAGFQLYGAPTSLPLPSAR